MHSLINGDEIINKQLTSKKITKITFNDGRKTTLTPSRFFIPINNAAVRLSLNGRWKVKKWPFDSEEINLCGIKLDDAAWVQVEQPGKVFYYEPEEDTSEIENWSRQDLTHIDQEDGAVLRKQVLIPDDWSDQRILLHFDAIFPAARVYCNGKLLGEHLSGLTPVEWDVTDIVSPGEEALVSIRLIRNYKYARMDMPRHALEFAGINQDAYFHAVGKCHISDFHLITALNNSLTLGNIKGQITITNSNNEEFKGFLKINVSNHEERQSTVAFSQEINIEQSATAAIPVEIKIKNPKLWNDEYPNLYLVEIILTGEGQDKQVNSYYTGFRKLDLTNQRPMLNGKPVKFRGINHLTFHPEYGMYTPETWLRETLNLMKKANINAIRTHFLAPPVLGDLCDELGFYLLQELPIDWGTNYIHDPEWVGPALMRLEGGVRRDRHHTSIMIWSVGNENMPESAEVADDGWNHLRIYDQFVKELDPSRLTMFPPPGPANKIEGIFEVRVGDVADIHYSFKLVRKFNETGFVTNPRSWEADMETMSREEAIAGGWSGIWFSSEYGLFNFQPDLLNAPYLSRIADNEGDPLSGKNTMQVFIDRLKEEWGYMRDDPTCLGGAYFPWMSSGAGNNPWGWVRWGEDADWGVVTANLLPKPAFWAMRVLFSPIQFPERTSWKRGERDIKFEIKNGYNSIDLERCTLRTMMAGGSKWMGQMRLWKDIPISCPPGDTVTVSIPIWNPQSMEALENNMPVACRCIVLDPSGFRPITADIIIIPESVEIRDDVVMPIGPDAEL